MEADGSGVWRLTGVGCGVDGSGVWRLTGVGCGG